MTQSVRGRSGVDTAGRACQSVSHLHRAFAHGFGALVHRLTQGEGAIGPTAAWGRKQQGRVLMVEPPLTQLLNDSRSDGHDSVLASLAVADVEPGWVFTTVDVANLNADGLAHAQTAMIH